MSLPMYALVGILSAGSIDADIAELAHDHVNVALHAWGYSHASASSVYQPGYDADRAIDGRWAVRETDKWNSAVGKGPHWLIVDLGHAFTFDAVVLRHEGVYGEGEIYNTSDFQVQRGDSLQGPWFDLVPPVRGNRADVSLLRFPRVRSRYVRFITDKSEQNGNAYARLFEIEIYSPKETIDIPMIRLDRPAVPTYRHIEGALQEAVQVHAGTNVAPSGFKIEGRPAKVEGGLLWLPASGKPVTVTRAQQGCPTASWSIEDDGSWPPGVEGGAIHILSSSHQDVAWMDTPDACRDFRVKHVLEPAMDLMLRDGHYRFTMENMLNLRELLQEHPEQHELIGKLLASGQLEFGGTYDQPYESLLGGEQLVRQVYFGRRALRKEYPGADTCVAFTVDVPGRSLQMQQILAKSGIKYLVTSRYHEGLFRWASPDGSSILVYALPIYGMNSDLLKQTPEAAVRGVPRAVTSVARDFAARSIPPHYMLLFSNDFEEPRAFGPLLDLWSKQPAVAVMDGKPVPPPSMDYSSTAGLFKSLDVSTAKPKELMGERPNMWLYIHGPTHHEAVQAQREAARLLPVAETFATMRCLLSKSFGSYPAQVLADAWRDSLYADHGWGGKNGHITDAVFHAKFASAGETARRSLNESLRVLASHVKSDPSKGSAVVVFNPHSWTRSDAVSVSAPTDEPDWRVLDSEGRPVPYQTSSAPRRENVARAAVGARILQATGTKAERLLQSDWWDPRKGWWESSASPVAPAEVVIDLGKTRDVDRLLVRHYGSLGEFQKETIDNTRTFRVYGALEPDGGWKELVGATVGNADPISVFEFAPTTVRYLKLRITDPNGAGDGVARILGIEAEALVTPAAPTITFHAADVPSLGYRTYYLTRRGQAARKSSSRDAGEIVENAFYRIELTPGGVASIFDKPSHKEMFRKSGLTPGEVFTLQSVGNGAGEFGAVQQPTMEGFDRTSAHKPQWKRIDDLSGPVRSVYELVQPLGGAKVRQTLVVYNEIKRIDFDVDLLGWVGAKYREFRIAFPIGGPRAKVSYEVPLGTVRVGEGEIKTTGGHAYGSLDYWQKCADIHPREVQDCIRVQDGDLTTTVSSCVSVFDWVDPTGMSGAGPLIQPILLASRRSCHGEGNWYIQPGDHHFHFSISSSLDSRAGTREAADAQLALMPVTVESSDGRLPTAMSFASLSEPNVRISTIKKAEDDDSVVLRCYDVDGRAADLAVRLFLPAAWAAACNMIEDEKGRLPIQQGAVNLHVGRFAIETLKLRL